jgi:uncharacterized protein YbjT (DUF2867 family)
MNETNSSMDSALLTRCSDGMTEPRTILVLGGTGKTGRRVADRLRAAGATVRTAARGGADVRFDWDDPATWDGALAGAEALYLVPPTLRLDHAPAVLALLDRAESAGVRHVTFLSASGVEHAPPEAALRAIELDLVARDSLTRAIVRPGWFMQNFSEGYFAPSIAAAGVVSAPTGDGAEAFVDADDIAAVVAATLLDPAAHAGAEYTLTGPEALTFAEAADLLSPAAGRPIAHIDPPVDEWVAATVAEGAPEPYARMLAMLLGNVREGRGTAVGDAVERVTGRPARSFAEYAATLGPASWGAVAA